MRTIREFFHRLAGSVRPSRSDSDLQEEMRLHLELAAEAEARRGLPQGDAARAAHLRAGGLTQAMEAARDQRSLPTLDALRADVIFGWRQLRRNRVASLSAILSLALAMGATLAAFRLVDAVLLRPLPVADPASLYALVTTSPTFDDVMEERDDFDYPTFRNYRTVAGSRADLMLIGMAARRQIQIDGGEVEDAVQQFVSGNVFAQLGLQPALGRLLSERDDTVPDGHPVVVLSHDYWLRRYGGAPDVAGKTFRMGARSYEIVGVAPRGFTGTEPGAITDFFVPSMMNPEALNEVGWSWFKIWLRPRAGATATEVEAILRTRFRNDRLAHAKTFAPDTPKSRIDAFLNANISLQSAAAGFSFLQRSFRRPLWILATLAALLLLIACANVANLLLARSMSRRIEMALRMSIGAARGRLMQLMLVESAMLALAACILGALFAAWAAPFIVSLLAPEEQPVRLVLDPDWRTVALGASLTVIVTLLFGVIPAVRASAVTPLGALKEMRAPGAQRRLTDALVVAQMAFCVFLVFGASLFVGTFDRLRSKPLGLAPERLLHIVAEGPVTYDAAVWTGLAARLREMPGVESVTVAGWAPLTGNRWRSSITAAGKTSPATAPNWVNVAPGYFQTMRMPMVAGREFRAGETPPRLSPEKKPVAGVAIVNQAFARVYFDGQNPVGRTVTVNSSEAPMEIVGMSADAVYFNVRETMHPAVFVPFYTRSNATLLVRTAPEAGDLRLALRREVTRIRPDIRARQVVRFDSLVTQQMIRERLLAALSSFFAVLALLLAVIGMYGVLNYAVTRERRDIGLRMALGARPSHVLTLITRRLVIVIGIGAVAGLAGAFAFGRTVKSLLFEMEPSDPAAIAVPLLTLTVAAAVAAIAPAVRAMRIDPAETLKSEA